VLNQVSSVFTKQNHQEMWIGFSAISEAIWLKFGWTFLKFSPHRISQNVADIGKNLFEPYLFVIRHSKF